MKATHTGYMHPRHLRVEDGKPHLAWNGVKGWHDAGALCVSPSSSDYARLNRSSLPKYPSPFGKDPIYERMMQGG